MAQMPILVWQFVLLFWWIYLIYMDVMIDLLPLVLAIIINPHDCVDQGCPNSVLEGRCPAEFSSNPNQTHLKQLIKLLLGTLEASMQVCWGKLELNSAGPSLDSPSEPNWDHFEGSGNICRCFELISWLACHHIIICWEWIDGFLFNVSQNHHN